MAIGDVLQRQFPGRRAQLKREILSAALACFVEQGIEATTIEDIRKRCDTSVGNLYHHFGNKEGLIAALFFCALDDQARVRAESLQIEGDTGVKVAALVQRYVDWVTAEPELARFLFQARPAVNQGPQAAELADRNRQRNRQVRDALADADSQGVFKTVPIELLPSLLIGQAESYCRAWLAGRVHTSPTHFRKALADAAWASLRACAQAESH